MLIIPFLRFCILLQLISKMPWFQECELWQDNSYEPRPGKIIFFDCDDRV